MSYSPKKAFLNILKGEKSPIVPFVIWDNKIDTPELANKLLEQNALIINKSKVYDSHFKTVTISEKVIGQVDGKNRVKTTYHTPLGDLDEVCLVETGSRWREEPMFKDESDYEKILYVINDMFYTPNFERYIKDDTKYGENSVARPTTEKTPFIDLMYDYFGVENFIIEQYENPEKMKELFLALEAKRKERLDIIAESPAHFVIIEGNLLLSMAGKTLMDEYIVPSIEYACNTLKSTNVVCGAHLDGNTIDMFEYFEKLSGVALIESFTPQPECDATFEQAIGAWANKAFIMNLPSSLHLSPKNDFFDFIEKQYYMGKKHGRACLGILENTPHNDFYVDIAEKIKNLNLNT